MVQKFSALESCYAGFQITVLNDWPIDDKASLLGCIPHSMGLGGLKLRRHINPSARSISYFGEL